MADTVADLAPVTGPAPIEVSVGGEGNLSLRDAANALSQNRYKREAAEVAPAEEIPAQPETAAPLEEATGEQPTEAIDQPDTPAPLDLPRSWAKDKAELWAKLDRDTQEYLLDHDSKASSEVRRSQNESAEARKSVEAERMQLEQARKQYEEALPTLLATLQQAQAGEFADIKTQADVENLARTDWPRYAIWDAKQKQIASVREEMGQTQQRRAEEFKTKWSQFAKDEDAKFMQAAPEMANKDTAQKVATASKALLNDLGFSDEDLGKLWNGEASVSLRDSRVQRLVRDAVRYREAQTVAKAKVSKPVPTVQRPGTAPQRAPDRDVRIAQLSKRLDEKGGWRDAAELLIAQRAARS